MHTLYNKQHTVSSNEEGWEHLEIEEEFVSSSAITASKEKWECVERNECKKSHQYTEKEEKIIPFNNTLAGLDQSWRELKEQAYGTMYDVGTWLEGTYKSVTEQAIYKPNSKNKIVEEEGEEMFEFIKPEPSEIGENSDLTGVTATQHASQSTQQR